MRTLEEFMLDAISGGQLPYFNVDMRVGPMREVFIRVHPYESSSSMDFQVRRNELVPIAEACRVGTRTGGES